MANKDYYKVLGLSKSASRSDIKAAFKKLAKKYHPDVNPGDTVAEEKFKEVSAAYEVLGDEDKRKKYDRFGSFDFGGSGPQDPYSQGFWQQGGFSNIDIEDIFGDIFGFSGAKRAQKSKMNFDFRTFGGGGGARQSTKGSDIQWTLPVDFVDAVQGCQKQILLPNGQKVKVKIPAGVDTGSKVRLKGKGNPGVAGGANGDLIIETQVRPHSYFKREGDDIHLDVEVDLIEALRGAKVTVPTVEGSVELSIPKGIQGGQKLRLKERGATNLKTKVRGHQYVHVRIKLPANLTEDELEQLEKILSSKRSPVRNYY